MIPDFDTNRLRRVPGILAAELFQMERDLNRMKGRDNRAEHEELIAVKRAELKFHLWSVKELLK